MSRTTSIILVVLSMLTINLVATAVASAESTNNPQWSLCVKLVKPEGAFKDKNCAEKDATKKSEFELTILGEGQTGVVEAVADPAEPRQILKPSVGGATIVCKALKLASATIKGSKAPNAGTSEEIIEYSECEVSGSPECKINKEESKKAKLTTNLLKDLLAYENEPGAKNEEGPTVTVFEPVTPKEFIKFELSGTCPVVGPVKVEGSVVAQNPEGAKHNETHELLAPEGAITKYFINKAGKTEEKKAEIKAFGVKSAYIGKSMIKVKDKTGGVQDVWGIHTTK